MSDLVKRLRRTLSDLPGNDDDLFNEIHAQRDEAADAIERLHAREARLREALRRVRTAIVEADPSVLICTLWMPDMMSETVVDHIDAALGEEKK